jgi:hypothetical protein
MSAPPILVDGTYFNALLLHMADFDGVIPDPDGSQWPSTFFTESPF